MAKAPVTATDVLKPGCPNIVTMPGTTTKTTTYTVRSVPAAPQGTPYTVHTLPSIKSATSGISMDELRNYFDEQKKHFMEDPRTKYLIDSGQATWEDFKNYVEERASRARPTAENTSTVYHRMGGYWYPVVRETPLIAAPNTLIEVGPSSADISQKISFRPRTDAYYDEEKKRLVLFVDLPGLEKKDVTLEIDRGALVVSGERQRPEVNLHSGAGRSDFISERGFGFFYRKFQLPSNASEDAIKATMENGVLEISIGVKEETSEIKKKIAVE